jgi:NTE family protein
MVAQRFAEEAAAFTGRDDVTILPPPCPIDVPPMDFGHAGRLMDRAQADACAFLDARALPPMRALCA